MYRPCLICQSTLMRAIANGQVDGFPPKDVLRTVYVEHDIDGSLSDLSCVEFVFADADLQAAVATTKEQVTSMLSSVGFDDAMLVSWHTVVLTVVYHISQI